MEKKSGIEGFNELEYLRDEYLAAIKRWVESITEMLKDPSLSKQARHSLKSVENCVQWFLALEKQRSVIIKELQGEYFRNTESIQKIEERVNQLKDLMWDIGILDFWLTVKNKYKRAEKAATLEALETETDFSCLGTCTIF